MQRTLLLAAVASAIAAADWTPATWRGQAAWSASDAGWTATVSTTWGRLVSLRTPDGDELVHAVDQATPADNRGGACGGHQAWLGPQARWGWPPPGHWEYAGAERVHAEGGILTLELPAGSEPRWPALTRVYAWNSHALDLILRWRSSEPWHALQVVQVRGDASVLVEPRPRPDLPAGFAIATPPGDLLAPVRDAVLPQPCAIGEDGFIRLRRGIPFQKLYLPPQTIRVAWKGWTLGMAAGPVRGLGRGDPDGGLTTQAFMGRQWDMYEIEQASPLLAGDAGAEATVRLIPGRAGGP